MKNRRNAPPQMLQIQARVPGDAEREQLKTAEKRVAKALDALIEYVDALPDGANPEYRQSLTHELKRATEEYSRLVDGYRIVC